MTFIPHSHSHSCVLSYSSTREAAHKGERQILSRSTGALPLDNRAREISSICDHAISYYRSCIQNHGPYITILGVALSDAHLNLRHCTKQLFNQYVNHVDQALHELAPYKKELTELRDKFIVAAQKENFDQLKKEFKIKALNLNSIEKEALGKYFTTEAQIVILAQKINKVCLPTSSNVNLSQKDLSQLEVLLFLQAAKRIANHLGNSG